MPPGYSLNPLGSDELSPESHFKSVEQKLQVDIATKIYSG